MDAPPHYLCHGGMRDTMTTVYSFLVNPSQLRAACTWTLMCYDHAIYLEVPLQCPYVENHQESLLADEKESSNTASCGSTHHHHRRCIPVNVRKMRFTLGSEYYAGKWKLTFENLNHLQKLEDLQGNDDEDELTPLVDQTRSLCLVHLKNLTEFGDNTWSEFYHLEEASITDLPALTSIGDAFLGECRALKKVVFARLPKLQKIGNNFLIEARALKHLELSDLPELVQIKDNWLGFKCGLEVVTISSLPKLTTIGDGWLKEAISLKTLTLFELPLLSAIGGEFLINAGPHFESFTLRRLPKLQSIGPFFLYNCSDLKSVTFEALTDLTSIGDNWLGECPKISSLSFKTVPQLQRIGKDFLGGCTREVKIPAEEMTEYMRDTKEESTRDPSCKHTLEVHLSAKSCHPALKKRVAKEKKRINMGVNLKEAILGLGIGLAVVCIGGWLACKVCYGTYKVVEGFALTMFEQRP